MPRSRAAHGRDAGGEPPAPHENPASRTLHKRRGSRRADERKRSDDTTDCIPTLTTTNADDLALLLHTGMDAVDAIRYLLPTLERKQLGVAVNRYLRSRTLVDAIARLNGKPWHQLEPQRRLELAMDKHLAEMAYFLYTTPFATFTTGPGGDFEKAKEARKALEAKLAGASATDAPMVRFMKHALEKAAKEATGKLEPTGMVETFEEGAIVLNTEHGPRVRRKPS